MLQVFYLDVLKIDLVLQLMFHMHISCVSSTFRRMLQVLHPDISKVDRVLHLSSSPSAASSLTASGGHPHDAAARSFRIGGAARPSSLIAWAARAPREARNGV